MCSLHLTHPSVHLEQWAADCAAPGEQSWTSCQSWDSNPQPWVTSGFKSNALSIRPTTALVMLADADDSPICHSVPVAEHINHGNISSLQSTSVNYI